jgi:hypothetical protein
MAGERNLMGKSVLVRSLLLRGALLGATALALVTSPFVGREAAAGVGVTSATDGDPLGKPPQEAERVLRIGIDVQANELITTSANDRAHLVFLDGSSLTVGPNAQLTIDKFVFDPNTKTGELAINASKGVLRLVGGKISKSAPITITTPSSTIGIRGGISIHDVSQQKTDSTFVFGKDMTVKAGGQTQTATRPGSLIVTIFGSHPAAAVLIGQGALNGQLGQLEGRRGGTGNRSGGGGGSGRGADQVAQTSGFSNVNSNQSVRIIGPDSPDNFGSGPGPRNRNASETVVTALSNANQLGQQTQAQQQLQQQAFVPLPPPPTQVPVAGPGNTPPPVGAPPPGTTPPIALPTTGSATFVGGMVGYVNGNPRNIDVGSYSSTWNFASNTGRVSARFGDTNFQGNMTGAGRSFGTTSPIQASNGRKLDLNGSFFGLNSQYQFGSFNVTSTPNGYNATGIFAGEKR